MAQSGKKNQDNDVLSAIYKQRGDEKESIVRQLQRYFSNPQQAEQWLTRAILFFGLVGIVFGFFHFRNFLTSPFRSSTGTQASQSQLQFAADQDLLGLSQKDTDQDGLSDFDELKIYGTSPYLSDSDSDGVTDQKEIAQNTDPSCPQGKNCFSLDELYGDTSQPADTSGPVLSVDELRPLLLEAGVSPEVLAGLSDEEISVAYQQLVGDSSQTTPTITVPAGVIENLTPDEIRTLLMEQGGISQDILDRISDQELMDFVKQTLQQSQ